MPLCDYRYGNKYSAPSLCDHIGVYMQDAGKCSIQLEMGAQMIPPSESWQECQMERNKDGEVRSFDIHMEMSHYY